MSKRTYKTLDEIKNISGRLYVRWSKSIAADVKRGYSRKYGTGREQGLSVCELDTAWADWRIIRQLAEYRFVGGTCWIVTGDVVGKGEDNEPLLVNVVCIGKIDASLTGQNWRRMEIEAEIADDTERLARCTNAIGAEILRQAIERNRANTEKDNDYTTRCRTDR